MAQLVERLVRNEEASGSNPLISTTRKGRLNTVLFYVAKASNARSVVFSAVRASNVRNERINKRAKTYRRCDALATGENIAYLHQKNKTAKAVLFFCR